METIGEVRHHERAGRAVLHTMRNRWLGLPPREIDPIPPSSLLSQVEQIKDAVENTYDLLLLLQLHGFNLNEDVPIITTPLFYVPCPRFSQSIPYSCVEDEERYTPRQNETIILHTRTDMLLREGNNNTIRLEAQEMLIITPSPTSNEVHVEGDGRHIILVNSSILHARPTTSTDTILPLGVIAHNTTTTEYKQQVKRVGNGLVAWEPITIQARRGALPITLSWIDVKQEDSHLPYTPPPQSGKVLNTLLLRELSQLIKLDIACRRVESILWRGINMLDRSSIHRNTDESLLIISCASEKRLDVDKVRNSRAVTQADEDYALWLEAADRWHSKYTIGNGG